MVFLTKKKKTVFTKNIYRKLYQLAQLQFIKLDESITQNIKSIVCQSMELFFFLKQHNVVVQQIHNKAIFPHDVT